MSSVVKSFLSRISAPPLTTDRELSGGKAQTTRSLGDWEGTKVEEYRGFAGWMIEGAGSVFDTGFASEDGGSRVTLHPDDEIFVHGFWFTRRHEDAKDWGPLTMRLQPSLKVAAPKLISRPSGRFNRRR